MIIPGRQPRGAGGSKPRMRRLHGAVGVSPWNGMLPHTMEPRKRRQHVTVGVSPLRPSAKRKGPKTVDKA